MEYRVFISQPMTGRTLDEVKKERQDIESIMHELDDGLSTKGISVKVIDSFDEQAFIEGRNPLDCIGDCIKKMSEANIVVFAPGWDKSRGCRIEHQCAVEYQLATIMLKDTTPHTRSKNNDTVT